MNNEQRKYMETVTIYVTKEQRAELERRAREMGLFLKQYIIKKCLE